MRKIEIIVLLFVLITPVGLTQIYCVQCYKQTETLSPSASNLVMNGSFENHNCPPGGGQICPASNMYQCDVDNWVVLGGGTSTYMQLQNGNVSIIPDGSRNVYFGNSDAIICSQQFSDTSCLYQNECQVNGIPNGYPMSGPNHGGINGVTIQQVVSGLTIGDLYALEFWAGGELVDPNDGIIRLDFGFNPIFLRCESTGVGVAGLPPLRSVNSGFASVSN